MSNINVLVNLGTVGASITGQTFSISGCTESDCGGTKTALSPSQYNVNNFIPDGLVISVPSSVQSLFLKVDSGVCKGTTQCIPVIKSTPTPTITPTVTFTPTPTSTSSDVTEIDCSISGTVVYYLPTTPTATVTPTASSIGSEPPPITPPIDPDPTITPTPTLTVTPTPTLTQTPTPSEISCDCGEFYVTIDQNDINDASGNTGLLEQYNGFVIWRHYDCNTKTEILTPLEVAGTPGYWVLCGCYDQQMSLFYYKNNASLLAIYSNAQYQGPCST